MGEETIRAQLSEDRQQGLEVWDGWCMCTGADCEILYYRDPIAIAVDEVARVPFHKSRDPDRLVCFCFDQSVTDILADYRAHGRSTLRETIRAACKAGQDDCARQNPQGRCCLGNLGKLLKTENAEDHDAPCC